MASLTTSLNTEFTPAAGTFDVQVTGGSAALLRKNSSSAAFTEVRGGPIIGAVVVDNPVAGAVYKLVSDQPGTVVVAVDQ
jgi:hypothetical protein